MRRELPGRPAWGRRLSGFTSAALAIALLFTAGAAETAPRVLSLDQCADQYVLALSPREEIVGLSTRARNGDSRLRALAHDLPLRRATLEAALGARPDLVVRNWGGDPRLVRALEARGVRVISLEDASDFTVIRRNIRSVAAALGREPAGEAVIAEMDARLARSAGAWRGRRALYLTPSGFTAGPGTLTDAMLRAPGMTNAERRPGFAEVSLEQLALSPPDAVVRGFFDTGMLANANWAPARHSVMKDVLRTRTVADLPGALMVCPDWGVAEAVELLAQRAPR